MLPNRKSNLATAVTFPSHRLPIVIIGSGPAGAIAALGAAKKGNNVLLVTKYPYAARTQRVRLDSPILAILKDQCEPLSKKDQLFFTKLKKNKNTVSLRSLEYFLQAKLAETAQKSNGRLKLVDDTIGELQNVDVQTHPPKIVLASYNKRTQKPGETRIEEERVEIPFRHLVDASGAKRAAYSLAAKNDKAQNYQHNLDKAYQPVHLAQGTATFHLTNTAKTRMRTKLFNKINQFLHAGNVSKAAFSKKDMQKLKEMGWDKPYKPAVYIIAANKKRGNKEKGIGSYYLGGEIPEAYNKINDPQKKQEKIAEWYKFILTANLREAGIKPNDIYTKGKVDTKPPESLTQTQDALRIQNQQQKWQSEKAKIKMMKKTNLPEEIAAEAVGKKIQLTTTGFDMVMSRINEPVRDLKKDRKHAMVAIGDALQTAHFHDGHGANDAIYLAAKFADALPYETEHRDFNFTGFNKEVSDIIRQHDARLKTLRELHPGASLNTRPPRPARAAPPPPAPKRPLPLPPAHITTSMVQKFGVFKVGAHREKSEHPAVNVENKVKPK